MREAEQSTSKKRRGRPPLLSSEQTAELIAYISQSRETRQMSYQYLATVVFTNWNVGEYAIRNTLRKAGYKRYIARAKPPLSKANKIKRLQWAHDHLTGPSSSGVRSSGLMRCGSQVADTERGG
jgi:hypothetical protein